MIYKKFLFVSFLILNILLYSHTTYAVFCIRFATEATYPPFSFVDQHNQLTGFEIELAQELCDKLNRCCIFSNQAFDSLILNLKLHRSDAIIAAMDITPERAQQVMFTRPYYNNSACFVVLKEKAENINMQYQQSVGVQYGSTQQKYLMEQCPHIHVISYDNYQNALIDLKIGRIQSLLADTAVARFWLRQDQKLATLSPTVTDPRYFGQGYAIALRKDDPSLLKEINAALQQLDIDGVLQQLQKKWLQ